MKRKITPEEYLDKVDKQSSCCYNSVISFNKFVTFKLLSEEQQLCVMRRT